MDFKTILMGIQPVDILMIITYTMFINLILNYLLDSISIFFSVKKNKGTKLDTGITIFCWILSFFLISTLTIESSVKPEVETCISSPESVFNISAENTDNTKIKIDYCNENNRITWETIDIEDISTIQDDYKNELQKLNDEEINQILEKEY